MAILSLIPKIYKKYQSNLNSVPPVPVQGRVKPSEVPFVNRETLTYAPSAAKVASNTVVTKNAPSTSVGVEEKAVWSGKMDANTMMNGIIFAEILQPPRAYRPFIRRK